MACSVARSVPLQLAGDRMDQSVQGFVVFVEKMLRLPDVVPDPLLLARTRRLTARRRLPHRHWGKVVRRRDRRVGLAAGHVEIVRLLVATSTNRTPAA